MSIRVPSVSELPTEAYYRSVYQTAMNNAVSQVPQLRIPNRYPPALRAANERRRAEAQARRENATLTPSGRVSRARLTPEQRVARRREIMRRNALFRGPLGDIVSTDVEETQARPVFTPVERDNRKRVAVGTRKIAAVRERIREVRRKNARPTSVRRVTPVKFPSVRSSYIKGEGTDSVRNGLRGEIYRQFAEHQKAGEGSFKMWLSLRADFKKTEVNENGEISEISREAFKNKSFNVISSEQLK